METLANSGVLSSATNVPAGWGDSAAAPAGASALDGAMSCYWIVGEDCTSSPPTVTGNLLWVLQVLQQTAAYSGNTTLETAVIFPLLDKAIQFCKYLFSLSSPSTPALTQTLPVTPVSAAADDHFVVDNGTGVVSLPPTFSPEYPGPTAPNANYDVALLKWALQYALGLCARFNLTSPHAARWADLAARLVPLQVDAASNTYSIYEGVPYAQPHRHFSHLLSLWPLHSLDLTVAEVRERAQRSVDLWSSLPELDSLFGRPACFAMNTLLGRPAAALDNLTFMLHTRIEGSGWYREPPGFGGQTVCNEAPFMAAFALVDAVIQSHNTTTLAGQGGAPVHVIEFFPFAQPSIRLDGSAYDAAPAKLAAASFFRLPAEGGYLASGQRREFTDGRCPASLFCTYTSFVAVEAPAAGAGGGGGGPLVIRLADMPRPLAAYPPGAATLTELGDGGLVQVVGLAPGAGVVVYSGSMDPPESFEISPSVGCPPQYNFFGGGMYPTGQRPPTLAPPDLLPLRPANPLRAGNIMKPESLAAGGRTRGSAGAVGTPVVLTNCSIGADGRAVPLQRACTLDNTPPISPPPRTGHEP